MSNQWVKNLRDAGLAALFLLSAVALAGCPEAVDVIEKAVQPPEIKVKQVVITGISYDTLDLNLAVDIHNQNPVGFTLAGLEYQLEIAERPLASGNAASGIEIAALGTSQADFPVDLLPRNQADLRPGQGPGRGPLPAFRDRQDRFPHRGPCHPLQNLGHAPRGQGPQDQGSQH